MQNLLKQLTALESELHHPGKPLDRQRLEQLLHPEFHEVGRSGYPYDRETVIRYLAGQSEYPDVLPSEHALSLLFQGCALLTYRSVNREENGELSRHTLRSSIWRLTEQGWQLFYHQGTPAAE